MSDLELQLRAAAARLPGIPLDEAALADRADRAGVLDVAVGSTDTPVGRLVLAVTDGGVAAVSYETEDTVLANLARRISPRILRAPRRVDVVRRQLDEYFERRRERFDVTVDLRLATPFGQQVLPSLGSVTYGETATYGQIATALGKPTAARAVGHALGMNPVCVIVPCHRVVGASGALTGYAGGIEAKRFLLSLEEQGS